MRPTIGIIGGTGWMGRAIARSMLEADFVDASRLVLSSRSPGAEGLADWPEVARVSDNRELAARSDIIILSTRPAQFQGVEIDGSGKLVISVMAGVTVATIAARTGAERIIRAMPNAAADIGRSYTPWLAAAGAGIADRAYVRQLLETCGTGDEVFREADIDYLTGLTGSGPAFSALLADAMLGHALKRGLPANVAKRAVQAVIAGASQQLAGNNASPGETVRTFLDYRGTTAAGLQGMIDGGFVEAVRAGLDAAETAAVAMSRVR